MTEAEKGCATMSEGQESALVLSRNKEQQSNSTYCPNVILITQNRGPVINLQTPCSITKRRIPDPSTDNKLTER